LKLVPDYRYVSETDSGGRLAFDPRESELRYRHAGYSRTQAFPPMTAFKLKYYDNPRRLFYKAAMTLTVDAECEFGANSGVSVWGAPPPNRRNPSSASPINASGSTRTCLMLRLAEARLTVPPIKSATAITRTPYFTDGDEYKA
jgi:hypothetical protein